MEAASAAAVRLALKSISRRPHFVRHEFRTTLLQYVSFVRRQAGGTNRNRGIGGCGRPVVSPQLAESDRHLVWNERIAADAAPPNVDFLLRRPKHERDDNQ